MMLLALFLSATLADQIAAYIGNDIVLLSEVQENMSIIANDPAAMRMFSDEQEMYDYIIDQLVANKLILMEAEQESIFVEEDDVLPLVDQNVENLKANFPSEGDFYKYLEEQNIILEELKKYYYENIRSRMIMERLISKKFASKIMISPIAVKDFYDENKDSVAVLPGRVKLSHILLPIVPSQEEMIKGFERATDVYKLLLTGGDFSVIAQEFSEDESSRRKGGMLGKIRKGETIEDFEAIVFDLKPGTISQPFPTRLGYHIVEILNKGPDWVLLRQILIKVEISRRDTLRIERQANELKESVMQGVDFDSLAKQYSKDPSIDLGEFYVDRLTPPFNEVVKDMAEGEVSEPILTPYGYHLLYVREKVPQRTLSFEELRDQIMQYLYQQEIQEKYDELIGELKQRTFVKKLYPT